MAEYFVHESSYVDAGARIGKGTKIWHFCHVMPGAVIGERAVVTSDVPAYALMVGVPARRVGWMCQCGERLPPTGGGLVCPACGATYEESDGSLRPVAPPSKVRTS